MLAMTSDQGKGLQSPGADGGEGQTAPNWRTGQRRAGTPSDQLSDVRSKESANPAYLMIK